MKTILFFLATTVAFAQFDSGQISGFVRDASQAVVPGATVAAVNQGNGGGPRKSRPDQCRTFGLVRTEESARQAAAGMSIWGVFKDPRVTVRSQSGDLGDAPAQAAQYFIEERDRQGGGSLKGHVLKSTPREVRVKLCLR